MKNKKRIIITNEDITQSADKKRVIIEPLRKPAELDVGPDAFDVKDLDNSVVKWDPLTLSWSSGGRENHLCVFMAQAEKNAQE